MRNPERIPRILEKLKKFWEKHPDLRLGQIVENLRSDTTWNKSDDSFYVEDEAIEKVLDKIGY